MINEFANYFESIARKVGLSIKIPRPSKTMKKACILTNGCIGIGFIVLGIVFYKVFLTLIGVLGIAGAILLVLDK